MTRILLTLLLALQGCSRCPPPWTSHPPAKAAELLAMELCDAEGGEVDWFIRITCVEREAGSHGCKVDPSAESAAGILFRCSLNNGGGL